MEKLLLWKTFYFLLGYFYFKILFCISKVKFPFFFLQPFLLFSVLYFPVVFHVKQREGCNREGIKRKKVIWMGLLGKVWQNSIFFFFCSIWGFLWDVTSHFSSLWAQCPECCECSICTMCKALACSRLARRGDYSLLPVPVKSHFS